MNLTIQFLSDVYEIQYMAQGGHPTSLDYFRNYAVHVIAKCETVLKRCDDTEVWDVSAIVRLLCTFPNFVLWISEHRVVAQIQTHIFSDLHDIRDCFVNSSSVDMTDESQLSQFVRVFLFIDEQLSTTLLKGESLSESWGSTTRTPSQISSQKQVMSV
jgi:hypothetical protein